MIDDAMQQSPAYISLHPTTRSALTVIMGEIERCGGPVALSVERLIELGIARGGATAKARVLQAVGLLDVSSSPPKANIFAGSDRWRSIASVEEARQRIADALAQKPPPRAPKPRSAPPQAPKPRKPPMRAVVPQTRAPDVPARPITLPAVPWATRWPQRRWDEGSAP